MSKRAAFLILLLLAGLSGSLLAAGFNLPPLPEPALYGNILINRTSSGADMKAVTFSHWSHRAKYTCTVCHLELEFDMMLNATIITEKDNKEGRYCGACHDGKTAFGHTEEHCNKCHNEDKGYGRDKFKELANLPATPYGNKINWAEALENGQIKPKTFLAEKSEPILFEKELLLEAEWAMIPPAVFPHKKHVPWLDCANCHPDIFNIKKKTTKHFAMKYILKNEFCGVCHGKVAFPLDDCKRCHPKIR